MAKILFIKSERMGRGNEELGRILMRNFLYTAARADEAPKAVYLVNDGVKLACEDSDSLDDLGLLVEAGVPVYSCGTCLDFLKLSGRLRIGGVGKMADLVDVMLGPDDIVTVS